MEIKYPLGASGFESATQTKILNTLAGRPRGIDSLRQNPHGHTKVCDIWVLPSKRPSSMLQWEFTYKDGINKSLQSRVHFGGRYYDLLRCNRVPEFRKYTKCKITLMSFQTKKACIQPPCW